MAGFHLLLNKMFNGGFELIVEMPAVNCMGESEDDVKDSMPDAD